MSTIEYRRATAADRSPWPKTWVDTLAATGRFFRNARGQILFLVNEHPTEYVPIGRREELRSVLEDAEFLTITGDELTADDWAGLYFNLSDHRWRLPSAGLRQPPSFPTPAPAARRAVR